MYVHHWGVSSNEWEKSAKNAELRKTSAFSVRVWNDAAANAWWCVVVAPLWLRVTDVVWTSECEGVRQRQSLTQPVSPQTGFPLLGQLASSQSHTKCFDSLFSTQRNCPVLTTDGSGGGPLTKESADFLIYSPWKEGAGRGVCVHWLADWETGMAGESVDCTSCILTGYKYFWVNLLQITSTARPLLPSARGRQQSHWEWVVTANLQAGMTK